MDKTYLIYKHTSPSGKSYIGLTYNICERTKYHKQNTSGCVAFNAAIKKYGWDSFSTEILAENLTLKDANELEMRLIVEHNTQVPNGYNIRSGGNHSPLHFSTKQKISEKLKGRVRSSSSIYKQKLTIQQSPRVWTTEVRSKISQAKLANNAKSENWIITDIQTKNTLQITSLRKWCLSNNLNYRGVLSAFRQHRLYHDKFMICKA